MIGKYLTDTTGLSVGGFIPAARHAAHNEDGVGGVHIYMPWWLDGRKLDFPRGYNIESAAAAACRARLRRRHRAAGSHGGGYGAALKDEYRKYYGATSALRPRRGCRATTDTARSTRTWWTDGGSRCCDSTGSGASTS